MVLRLRLRQRRTTGSGSSKGVNIGCNTNGGGKVGAAANDNNLDDVDVGLPCASDIESNESDKDSNDENDSHYDYAVDRKDNDDEFDDSDDDNDTDDKEQKNAEKIARKEHRAVIFWKVLVALVLLGCTIGTAVAMYRYASSNEQSRFEETFHVDAQKVEDAIYVHLLRTMGSLDALAASMVSFAAATNQSWPFVTVPDFAIQTSKIRSLSSGLVYIQHLPLVQPEERLEWEKYSMENSDWVNQSMVIQSTDVLYHGPIMYNFSMRGVIHGNFDDVPYNQTRPLLPTWQSGPIVPIHTPFNYDYLSVTNPQSLYEALNSRLTIISEAYGLPDQNSPQEVEEAEVWYDWYSYYIPPDEDSTEPVSDIYYPIFETRNSTQIDRDQHDVVGLLAATWYWRDILKQILPEDSIGIAVVFRNPCNSDFTYVLNGEVPVYFGRGDRHQPIYDDSVHNSDFSSLNSEGRKYSNVPFNTEYCPFSVDIYPTTERKKGYTTKIPTVAAIVAVSIFIFTACVFLVYDLSVERRQKVVMKTAVTSRAVVSSLYPEVVREQIEASTMQLASTSYHTRNSVGNEIQDSKSVGSVFFKKRRRSGFLMHDSHPSDGTIGSFMDSYESDEGTVDGYLLDTNPIAYLYPETTVMLADIAGFTAWSSAREPTKVFLLLETLYRAFDGLAKHCKVFKIESIGDAYVAVAGLPKPQSKHAVIMARFASLCIERMNTVVVDLEKRLGPGTASLQLRVGLNSGPTTAGVLRSEKSLFQIFGDTVNTASRMETTGYPSRIQASQKTADLLRQAGKASWVTPRQDLIIAKGKGEMQTFWIELSTSQQSKRKSEISSISSRSRDEPTDFADPLPPQIIRLVDWVLDLMEDLILQIVATNQDGKSNVKRNDRKTSNSSISSFHSTALRDGNRMLLRDFISSVASMHHGPDYEDFGDAVNVINAIVKILSTLKFHHAEFDAKRQDHHRRHPRSKPSPSSTTKQNVLCTLAIVADPLFRLALFFAGLVHNLSSEPGVGNSQSNRSAADRALEFWMEPGYGGLRDYIFSSTKDLERFCKLVTIFVNATEVKDLHQLADLNLRWESHFGPTAITNRKAGDEEGCPERLELKHQNQAQLVAELVIQASYAHHYFHHWSLYLKRSEVQFRQRQQHVFKHCCDQSYLESSQNGNNPIYDFYTKELQMFDEIIIPLAKNIKECELFDFSCREFLDYAISNRNDWESRGVQIVSAWMKKEGARQQHIQGKQQPTCFEGKDDFEEDEEVDIEVDMNELVVPVHRKENSQRAVK